ncbi:hypothetical protein [Caulobacter sp. NIBR2454]|uniref:hypothetical protein n=1 Tax=Caulobacter sp. NIBR2454 TaxID=3015996 RepID=UPI0022B6304D|nr:hypothetical protein [Caulobacter sp. NIBR2454]
MLSAAVFIAIVALLFWIHLQGPAEDRADAFIFVEDDGSVRELTADERLYSAMHHPADGNRPYVKTHYGSLTPEGLIGGFLHRSGVPQNAKWVAAPCNSEIDGGDKVVQTGSKARPSTEYEYLPEFQGAYLEDSYFLGLIAEGASLRMKFLFALTTDHPEYSPPRQGEAHYYREGSLLAENPSVVKWKPGRPMIVKDLAGPFDFGGIELYRLGHTRYQVITDWFDAIFEVDDLRLHLFEVDDLIGLQQI